MIRGRHLVVELEPRSVLLRLKGEGPKGERYRFTLEQLFYQGADRAAQEELRRARSRKLGWRP